MDSKPTFQIRMVGEGVTPESVSAGDLADFMTLIESAISSIQPDHIQVTDTEEATISLVGIGEGSNRLTFAVVQKAMIAVSSLSIAIASDNFSDLPRKAHEKLHEVSKQAIRKGWAIEFVPDKKLKVVRAIISDEKPVPPPSSATISGLTTITGKLMRVGGATPHAVLRLGDDSLLYFELTADMAKRLSGGLYETVAVEGKATWQVEGMKLMSFKGSRITEYRPEQSTLLKAFEELAIASNGCWDDVDVTEFVNELRSEI